MYWLSRAELIKFVEDPSTRGFNR